MKQLVKKEYQIYILKDPVTLKIRYVGVTTRTLPIRLYNHIYYAKFRASTHVHHWIMALIKNKQKPIIELLEKTIENKWEERERYWIAYYKKTGLLTNIKEGGQGVNINRSLESIEKSASAKSIAIVQLDTNNKFIAEFSSIKIAAKYLETTKTNISNVLNGRAFTARGYRWFYKTEYESLKFKPNDIKFSNNCVRKIKRINLETNEETIYNSITEASKKNNIRPDKLTSLLRSNNVICIFKFNYIK